MSLTPNFELTPRESYFRAASDNRAQIYVYGPTFYPKYNSTYRSSFDPQHADDELYFWYANAADPAVDYSVWSNRRLVPHVRLYFDLTSFGANKELALVFGFDAASESRLLIYSAAGQLSDETLVVGDNQFLMEVESLGPMNLYFVHAANSTGYGGEWFFRGITGYVI